MQVETSIYKSLKETTVDKLTLSETQQIRPKNNFKWNILESNKNLL